MHHSIRNTSFKRKALSTTLLLTLGAGLAYADITSNGNNFTMIDPTGATFGGANDVVFTWNGTLNTAVSGAVSNATLTSNTPFFGTSWTAHHVTLYGPGTYTVYSSCAAGDAGCGTGASYTFTVGAGEIGAHMLFDWSVNTNIDVVDVWSVDAAFGPSTMYTDGGGNSSQVWDHMSKDWDGDGFNGAKMIDGPFAGFSANFNVMGKADTEPDPFSFTDESNVPASTPRTSNEITVGGINAPAPISIFSDAGGTYSVNGGVPTSADGTVSADDKVVVQHTSSATPGGTANTTLTIGGVSDIFTSTTLIDTKADPFTFTDEPSVPASTPRTSNEITVSDIDQPVSISIYSDAAGTYSINGGAPTSADGTVSAGDKVVVQHTSSATPGGTANSTLTLGSGADAVSDTFTSTTEGGGPDTEPDTFEFTDEPSVPASTPRTSNEITVSGINQPVSISISSDAGGTYSVNGGAPTSADGTVSAGDKVVVQHTSSATPGGTANTTLTIGSGGDAVSDIFTSTTEIRTKPDPFTLNDESDVPLSTLRTSNEITVSGIDQPVSISISSNAGGTYSVNGGTPTSADGTVSSGDKVVVQHTSSATPGGTADTTVTIGSGADAVSDTFTSTSEGPKTTPDPFTFIDEPSVPASTLRTSNEITIEGINQPVSISISSDAGGTYSVNGGAPQTGPGTVSANDKVVVQHTSSATPGGTANTELTIGGVSDTFTSTTAGGTRLSNFTMLDPTGAVVGGTNDVQFTYTGTPNTNPATAVVNATLASAGPTAFFGQNWTAYNVKVYAPGSYTLSTTDSASDGDCPFGGSMSCVSGPDYVVNVSAGQLMAHMKFAWGATQGIDVVVVWEAGDWNVLNPGNGIWSGPGGTYGGPTYDHLSIDWDGDGLAGGRMIDGPFVGYSANFSVMPTGTGEKIPLIPDVRTVKTTSKLPGCTISTRPISPLERGDWWLVGGFVAWLAWVRRRSQRHSLH